jgi:uncharacterized membrane protein
MPEFGRFLIVVGIVLVVLGLLLTFAGKIPWLGRLPGDIYYKTDRVTIYFPLMTSLVLSVLLTLLLYLFRR